MPGSSQHPACISKVPRCLWGWGTPTADEEGSRHLGSPQSSLQLWRFSHQSTRSYSAGQMVWSFQVCKDKAEKWSRERPDFLLQTLDKGLYLRWIKVKKNEKESSSGQESPLGGPSKGSTEVLIWEILNTAEICSGLKLHLLKVTFIFYGMLYSPRKILFSISWRIFTV